MKKNLLKGSKKLIKFAKLTQNEYFINEAQKNLRKIVKAQSRKYKTRGYKEKRLKVLEQKTISQYENTLRRLGNDAKYIDVRTENNRLKVPNLKDLNLKQVRESTKSIRGNYLKRNFKTFNISTQGISKMNNIQGLLTEFNVAVLANIWKYPETLKKYFKEFFATSKNKELNEKIKSLFGNENLYEFMNGLQKLSQIAPAKLEQIAKSNKEIADSISIVEGILKK